MTDNKAVYTYNIRSTASTHGVFCYSTRTSSTLMLTAFPESEVRFKTWSILVLCRAGVFTFLKKKTIRSKKIQLASPSKNDHLLSNEVTKDAILKRDILEKENSSLLYPKRWGTCTKEFVEKAALARRAPHEDILLSTGNGPKKFEVVSSLHSYVLHDERAQHVTAPSACPHSKVFFLDFKFYKHSNSQHADPKTLDILNKRRIAK